MTPTRRTRTLLVLAGCTFAGAVCLAAGCRPAAEAQPAAAPKAVPAAEERPADRDAVKAALASFAAAFQKGDGKALSAHWTAEGEYIEDDGTSFRGRAALEKAYGEFFAKNKDNALEVEVESIRFPSKDTAVVEGHFKLRKGPKRELIVSKCSFLYAREDGKWLIAIAREWPGDGLTVRDLEWLVGTWEVKRDTTVVRTHYEWAGNKAFLRCRFTITQDGTTTGGTQMIGKDPATGALRVWTFEDDGGVGEAEITRDGKKWVFHAGGTTSEGRSLSVTNLMTPVDADSFLWQAVERVLDGEDLADLPPVKVTRVKK
jgi:uncharacterized protein (TIGR02246 family)